MAESAFEILEATAKSIASRPVMAEWFWKFYNLKIWKLTSVIISNFRIFKYLIDKRPDLCQPHMIPSPVHV
jgi:hypothetical protein